MEPQPIRITHGYFRVAGKIYGPGDWVTATVEDLRVARGPAMFALLKKGRTPDEVPAVKRTWRDRLVRTRLRFF